MVGVASVGRLGPGRLGKAPFLRSQWADSYLLLSVGPSHLSDPHPLFGNNSGHLVALCKSTFGVKEFLGLKTTLKIFWWLSGV